MVYQTYIKKKKRFDEEGDEDLPQKNRPFRLKNSKTDPNPPAPAPAPEPTAEGLNDEDGLDTPISLNA